MSAGDECLGAFACPPFCSIPNTSAIDRSITCAGGLANQYDASSKKSGNGSASIWSYVQPVVVTMSP